MEILHTRAATVVKYLKCKNRLKFIEYVGKREKVNDWKKNYSERKMRALVTNQVNVEFGLIITLSQAHIGKQIGHMLIHSFESFFSRQFSDEQIIFCDIVTIFLSFWTSYMWKGSNVGFMRFGYIYFFRHSRERE